MKDFLMKQIQSGQPQPIARVAPENNQFRNPFITNQQMPGGNTEDNSPGVNRPLRRPMFMGYQNNKPIYAGSQLFVLC